MGRLLCLLFALAIVVAGCSEADHPLLGNDRQDVTGTPVLQSVLGFSDDFEAGLDPAVWYCEVLGQGQWIHAVEGDNGYIHSTPQIDWSWDNRQLDLLTHRADFTDFTMTWDMRFHTQSWHQDGRFIYFRSDAAPNPSGYIVNLSVWAPTVGGPVLGLWKLENGSITPLQETYVSYPWTLEEWYSLKLSVSGNQFSIKAWKKLDPEPDAWTLQAMDPSATFAAGRIGFGDYWDAVTDVDNVVVTPPFVPVSVDVKPGACPNPMVVKDRPENTKARKGGVLTVAIFGTADFDAASIDVSSLRLQGVSPVRSSYEDVGTPASGEECACALLGADGFMDLTLKFDQAAIADALGPVSGGQSIALAVTGELLDGTAIAGGDCVEIVR